MSIFPDILLPATSGPLEANGAALPPADSSGVMPGLDAALLRLLRNYRPGDIGICELDPKIQLTLPVEKWADYSWYECRTTPIQAAGSSGTVVVWTVPANERNTLYNLVVTRASGDNLVPLLQLVFPAGYQNTSPIHPFYLTSYAVAETTKSWPTADPADFTDGFWGTFVDLEPGTRIEFTLNGTGAATTTWTYQILLKRSPLVLA